LSELTPAAVDRWEDYSDQEPWGDECWYLAIIASWVFNANFKLKDDKELKPEDVVSYVELLKTGRDVSQPQQSPEEVASTLRAWGNSIIAK